MGKEFVFLRKRLTLCIVFSCTLLLLYGNSVKDSNSNVERRELDTVNVSDTELLSVAEIKDISEKSYKLAELAKDYAEQNQHLNMEPFKQALQPYFTEAFISKLNSVEFTVPTGGNFPADFDYQQHFIVKDHSKNKIIVETAQTSYNNMPLIYTIEAEKEQGQWKINNLDYMEHTDSSSKAMNTAKITEKEAGKLVGGYLLGDEYIIESVKRGKENVFYINAFVEVSSTQMIGVSLKMDRLTGKITSLMAVNS